MAQLKDTIVSGNLRVTDTTLTDTLQVTTIKAPTSAGGTTYGPGTNGQVLKSNGTTTYWGADNNSSTVLQSSTTTSNFRPFVFGTKDTTTISSLADTVTGQLYTSTRLFFQPSSGNLYMYSPSGDSPALIFQRGTFIDSSLDWKMYDTGGALRFAQAGRNTSTETWVTVVEHKTATNTASTPAIRSMLGVYGATYGNTAANMLSGTAGVFQYGDGGPQIDFSTTPGAAQSGALIFTDNDTAATGASWHFVSTESDWNVTSKRFHAKTSISIGTNLPNTSYNLYVYGTTNITGATTIGGLLTTQANQYGDNYNSGAIDMQNSNLCGVNAIYTGDTSDNAAEGIHFYRDSTHVDTLWMNGGVLLFVPNRELGSNTSAADSQKVARFTVNPTGGQVVITDSTSGGVKSSGYTIATSVPSGAVFTDTKVTSSANHYTPSTASGSDKSASASGATAAWSIDVVKGITINTDGKGHITGLSVTSGKIPANPNTTYTLGTSGNNVTLTPSSGSVQSITAPYATKAGLLAYGHSNEINFSGGKQATCHINYRDADTDAQDTGETPISMTYRFCNYRNSTADTTIVAANFEGNASTATKWQTARTLTIGSTGKSVDGSGNVSWSLAEIGAAPAVSGGYLPLSGGTLTGRVTTAKFLNYIVKGTGTAGADKGSGQNPRYVPAKWTFDTGQTASDGDIIFIKIPVAGHDYGVYISINNGTSYHPAVISGSSRLTTHYGNGNYAAFTFRSDGSAASMIPLAGNTDGTRVTVTGGVWQGIDYYDSGNTYDRTSMQTRIYAGGVGVFRYSICAMNNAQRMESFTTTGDASGSPTTTKTFNTSAKFAYPPVIMYNNANAVYSNGTVIANNVLYEQYPSIDMRYSCNKTSSSGFAQYKPIFIECTFDANGYFSITSNGFVQTFTSGKYYILVGCMYSTSVYQLALFAQHPLYYYDGTNLRYMPAPHTHSEYLPLAGGTMTGPLTMKANQYSGTYGLDMNNSDIVGANRIVFADLADSYTEGLAFYRTTTDNVKIYDNFWIKDGAMYFTPNAPTATTSYTVLHTGNLSTYVKASTNNGKISVNGSDVTVYTHPTKTAQSTSDFYKITVDSTGHVTTGDALTAANLPSHTHAYTVPPSAFAVQTGSTKQSHITLQTLMTWLITTKAYIASGTNRSLTLCTTWSYADNDILQLSIDGVNYELQLAGVIIEFDGAATSYNAGTFRLRIHSSPTVSFTPASGYTQFPASHIAEYTCNGSSYSPTWKMLIDRSDISDGTSTTGNGTISVAGKAVSVYGLGSAAYTASTAYLPSTTTYAGSTTAGGIANQAHYLVNERLVSTSMTYGSEKLEWYDLSANNGNDPTKKQNPENDWFHHITMHHKNNAGYYFDMAYSFHSNAIYYRRVQSGTDKGWVRLIDSSNTSFSRDLTSGTKIGSITIAGTATDIYAPTNTDTTVTSSANHYTPATASGSDKTASASGATAAWSIDVVKGVTLNTDGKGHVTGISVTSGKIPANPVPSNNVTGSGTSGYLTKWDGTNTITNGPQLGSSTTTFLRNDGSWATPTNTDEKVKVDLFTSTTSTDYMITGATAAMATTAAHLVIDTADGVAGVRMRLQKGTTSAVGQAMLMLGNNIASGTAKNMQGSILMYASTAYYGKINTAALTDNHTWTMPNKTGTVALTSDIPSFSVTSSGTGPVVTGMSYSSGVLTYTKGRVLSTSGGQWIAGRDNAPVLANSNSSTVGSFYPIGAVKTNTGAWAIGALGNGDSLAFSFSTDTNYSGGTNTTNNYYIGTDGAFTGTAAGLTTKAVTASTINTTPGSFVFGGTNIIGGVNDWVGFQADAGNDRFQIIANSQLVFRQNDAATIEGDWGPWLGCLTPNNVSGDSGITITNITTTIGTGDAALTYNSGVKISHTNSITEETSTVFKKFSYDANGHITGVASVAASDIPALNYIPNTQTGVNTAINLLSVGSSNPNLADYYISQYAGGGTTTTSYHRRPISALWNTFKGLITLETTGTGNAVTAVSIANDGDNNRKITVTKGSTFSLSTHNHDSNYVKTFLSTNYDINQPGYYAVMANKRTDNPNIDLPTANQWWHVLSMSWAGTSSDVNSWISQLAIPTYQNKLNGLYWRTNSADSTALSANDWKRVYCEEKLTPSTTTKTRNILHIYGSTVGNTASELVGGVKGVLSYGDAGPQINFSTAATIGSAQDSAIIWTDNDSAATGVSWHFVSNQTDWNVISKRFHARTGISIGTDLPNTTYNLYVNGTTYHSDVITFGAVSAHVSPAINIYTRTSSTYNTFVKWSNGSTWGTRGAEIGYHNTGGDTTNPGTICILPYQTETNPWDGQVGLFIKKDHVYIDGVELSKSDTNVTQTATTTNADYEVLFSATADNTTRTEAARKNSNLKFNPSTGMLTTTTIKGGLYSYNPASDQTLSNAYPTYTVAYFVSAAAYGGSTGRTGNSGSNYWAHYLTFTHSDRNYRYLLRFPYWGPPQYQHTNDGGNKRWCSFITDEHAGNYSRYIGTGTAIDPITGAMHCTHRANKLAFLPAANITVQTSTDSGSTWTNMSVSDDLKRKIFSIPVRNSSINIGPSSGNTTTSMQTRIIIECDGREAVLNRFMFEIGSSHQNIAIDVYAGTTIAGLTKISTGDPSSTWAYEAVVTIDHNPDKYYRFSTSNYKYFAFVFRYTYVDSNYPTERGTINGISGYSGNYWGNNCKSNLAHFDHLYSWDIDQNALFPATVQGEKLAVKSGTYTTTIEKGATSADRTLVLPDTSGGIGVANILFNTPTNSTNPVPVSGSLSDYDYFTIVISLNGANSDQSSSAIIPAIAGSHYFLFQILESVGSGGSMIFPAGIVITEASGTISFTTGVNRGINIPSSGTATSIATPRTAYIKMIIGHKS